MGKKRIVTIGLELASPDVEHVAFHSTASLLDWDIVLFRPVISQFCNSTKYFEGKLSLGALDSFKLKECSAHWRREVRQAAETGKTVIVFLSELENVIVDSGKREYSGTGRNQKTTILVDDFNNYRIIPLDIGAIASKGRSMKLVAQGVEMLAPYWAAFENVSSYNTILEKLETGISVVTRSGDRPVGAVRRSKKSTGSLLLLPDIDFERQQPTKIKNDERIWDAAAKRFATGFVSAILALDDALRKSEVNTPEPDWARAEELALSAESVLGAQLLEAERRLDESQREKERIEDELKAAGAHRALLYEKGKPLEKAIIAALKVIGFSAEKFREGNSEFDVIFESSEGRFIGEAEGRDNRAINVDKLRQLAMNVHEDLARENVTVPAKPVLFGNGFRLQPLEERAEPFTEKCTTAATIGSTALVATPDLFRAVQYVLSNQDAEYARQCRLAIVSSIGRVRFPQVVEAETPDVELKVDAG